MNVKRYFAKTAREALRALKEELGGDAIVLSNRAIEGGVEILALPADAVGTLHAPAPVAPTAALVGASPEGREPAADDEADFRVSLSRAATQSAGVARTPVIRPFDPPRVGLPQPNQAQARPAQPYAPAALQRKPREAAPEVVVPPPPRPAPRRPEPAAVAPAPAPARSSVEELERIKALEASNGHLMSELSAIRALLERQLAGFAWGETARQAPLRAQILGELLENGFSSGLARALADTVPEGQTAAQARASVKDALNGRLRALDSDTDIIDRGGVYALVGPTGVGKTTTTAKLAARCVVRHGASKLALVTTDGYRIGAHEQLRIYGRILGVPVFVVRDASDLRQTLAELKNKHMVLIDTVGMSQRDRMVAEQAAMLIGAGNVRRLLLLNATCRGDTLDDVVRAYRGPDLVGCLLTKVDEAATLAPALDALVRHDLELFYVANGQRVPEDLHLANRAYLMHRALRELPRESPHRLTEEEAGLVLASTGLEH